MRLSVLMKNYGDRGGVLSEISIILHMIRKPNSITVLLFIQNNSQFKNIAETSLSASMLSLSSIVYVQVLSSSANILQIADVALRVVFLLFLLCFQPLFRLVPAVVPTLETSQVSAILVFTTKTTQSRPQVFSVKGALTCRRKDFLVKHKIFCKFGHQ